MVQPSHTWAHTQKKGKQGLKYIWVPRVRISLIQNSQKAEERINGWTDDWVRKTWSIRTLEYYSILKRKGVQTPAATQVSLIDIMLDEINPSWKDVILLYYSVSMRHVK